MVQPQELKQEVQHIQDERERVEREAAARAQQLEEESQRAAARAADMDVQIKQMEKFMFAPARALGKLRRRASACVVWALLGQETGQSITTVADTALGAWVAWHCRWFRSLSW